MESIKEILEKRPGKLPGPPVLVIDETTIHETHDAGPVCGCQEKYQLIQNYVPFIPGGINPYKRRQIPESECFDVSWTNIRIGSHDLQFEKPIAKHMCELPKNYQPKPRNEDLDDMMHLIPPKYTEDYYRRKLIEYQRNHYDGCDCPNR